MVWLNDQLHMQCCGWAHNVHETTFPGPGTTIFRPDVLMIDDQSAVHALTNCPRSHAWVHEHLLCGTTLAAVHFFSGCALASNMLFVPVKLQTADVSDPAHPKLTVLHNSLYICKTWY